MGNVEVSEELLKIKDLIKNPTKRYSGESELKDQLQILGHKVDKIERIVVDQKGRFNPDKIKEIVLLLENKDLNPSQVGQALHMSRNRANEYLRSMERDKLVISRLDGKKKLYRSVKHD